ncbi:transposase [uncultured Thiohalocapsa sp.]|uniref:IS4/Tn5 family transposase DNA-binding protein n=1 Tax=uncultured Thiohalocapsa sp. TaxID=768990 RepID=UPI0025D7A530|nr:transposase [uncultured Thiohalocapsa sp.]
MGWAAEEFRDLDLGDKRPKARTVLLAERLADRPTASLPGACAGRAETQGAYRFRSYCRFWCTAQPWRDGVSC